MYFLFSGEGPTDLGRCSGGGTTCSGDEYQPGPWALVADRIIQQRHDYSPLEAHQCGYVPESTLTQQAAALKAAKKSPRLPGKRREKETGYYFTNARAMARIAAELQQERGDEVVAVLFRDADGTASAGRGQWDAKRRAMHDGFAQEGFSRGVPMIPKPKSEAWVLCAIKQSYSHCAALEDRSGNDASPNSLKQELADHCGGSLPSREELCDLVTTGQIDASKIDMPSLKAFVERLEEVI